MATDSIGVLLYQYNGTNESHAEEIILHPSPHHRYAMA